jgi:hypothetical protein
MLTPTRFRDNPESGSAAAKKKNQAAPPSVNDIFRIFGHIF